MMHLSYEPDAKRALSGEKKIVIVPSYYEPEASRLPSGEKANELTRFECLRRGPAMS